MAVEDHECDREVRFRSQLTRKGNARAGSAMDRRLTSRTESRPRTESTGMRPRLRIASAAFSESHASAQGVVSFSAPARNECTGSPPISPPAPPSSMCQPSEAKDLSSSGNGGFGAAGVEQARAQIRQRGECRHALEQLVRVKIVEMFEGKVDLRRSPGASGEVERSCELGADGVEVIAVHPQWPAPGGIPPSAEVAEDRHAQWGIFIKG